MECYRGGSRWNVVGEGPDGMLSGRVPMECVSRSQWNRLGDKKGGGGVSVCGWIGTGNCEDYVNHESRKKIVIHE